MPDYIHRTAFSYLSNNVFHSAVLVFLFETRLKQSLHLCSHLVRIFAAKLELSL